LGTIDQKIELNNKINAELEAMAKLIYDYWFLQFDFPDANGKPYKSSGGKMVYSEEINREIPAGWSVNKIGDLLHSELGGTPSTKVNEYWQGEIPWLDSGEIANFPIIESEKHISQKAISNSATTLMSKGTCALSITRHLRPSILAVNACANQSVVGIFENEELKHSFIYPYLVNEIPRLMTLRTGAQQPHINKGIVDASPIVIPLNKLLKVYYEKVDSMYNQINNNAFQNKELTELRDWLLPMLMNGQVTVK
jgi:type I restriction enzyme S subunit